MNDKIKSGLDKSIFESLSEEEKDFLARLDEEPKYTDQAYGILKGRFGFINWMTTILIFLTTIVAVYALIRFFKVSPDIAGMLKWGGLTAYCAVGILVSKLYLAMHMQSNRVLRELKKLELQIASLKRD
jgi:hypothetical protein